MLEAGFTKTIPLMPEPPSEVVLLYSDAEGYGGIAAVAVFPRNEVHFLQGHVPRNVKRGLKQRKTQIVAFELLAGLIALAALCPERLRGRRVVHFVDSSAALACIIRGFSRELDLADIAGRFWFEALGLGIKYEAHFVASKCNLADGPSRGDITLMESLGAKQNQQWSFPVFSSGFGGWIASTSHAYKLVA